MSRKGYVTSWADLFKGLLVGIIVGALIAAAVGYYWFYAGSTASTQNPEENTQPSALEEGLQLDGQDSVRMAALADTGSEIFWKPVLATA